MLSHSMFLKRHGLGQTKVTGVGFYSILDRWPAKETFVQLWPAIRDGEIKCIRKRVKIGGGGGGGEWKWRMEVKRSVNVWGIKIYSHTAKEHSTLTKMTTVSYYILLARNLYYMPTFKIKLFLFWTKYHTIRSTGEWRNTSMHS